MSYLSMFMARWPMYIAALIIGLGLGWLIGLSTSPVVSILITSLTGAAAAVIATLGGLSQPTLPTEEGPGGWHNYAYRFVDPWPLAVLIVGIVIGSSAGVWARTNDWLGINQERATTLEERARVQEIAELKSDIQLWSELTGRNAQDVADVFFLRQDQPAGITSDESTSAVVSIPASRTTQLFGIGRSSVFDDLRSVTSGVESDDEEVLTIISEELKKKLKTYPPPYESLQVLATVEDPGALVKIIGYICPTDNEEPQ